MVTPTTQHMNTQLGASNFINILFYSRFLSLLFKSESFIFVNCFDVLCNTSFKGHIPEVVHNRRPKHVGGYAVYNK